ncbi:MAG TPA: type I-E CRISPR-associated protein Cas7/Cse4/CasC [bacterium]|nr:type I-E CRISPR-associated protein Cas7/Cse4/CasC [bacterium]
MSEPKFLQLHFLTSYPASLLNRDDVGLAKRVPFGGTSRIRISSQCLKRHWRTAEDSYALSNLGLPMSLRSRKIFEKEILPPLVREGFSENAVRIVLDEVSKLLLGKSVGKRKQEEEVEDVGTATAETNQVIVLGRPEIQYILNWTRTLLQQFSDDPKALKKHLDNLGARGKEMRQNFEALAKNCKAPLGLDAALFGRMVTSDILSRGDAAVHVAHAFTVHGEEVEADYFTAVDDLVAETEELGSAHLGETELTSGLFYGYVVVDIPQLVSNIEGCDRKEWQSADRTLAGQVVEHLVHLIATVSPGAKRGSTAPYSYAHLLLAECGQRQPRTLANAFLKPVDLTRGDVLKSAVLALSEYLQNFDRMYGREEERRVAAIVDLSAFPAEKVASLKDLATWCNLMVKT